MRSKIEHWVVVCICVVVLLAWAVLMRSITEKGFTEAVKTFFN